MAIKKQEFYEGAALHLLARTGGITSIRYDVPFFLLNNHLLVLMKYSTRGRSPWGFTFTADEQALLQTKASELETVIGLICGADGIATFTFDAYKKVAALRKSAVHIACYRNHGEHYEVNADRGGVRPESVLYQIDLIRDGLWRENRESSLKELFIMSSCGAISAT